MEAYKWLMKIQYRAVSRVSLNRGDRCITQHYTYCIQSFVVTNDFRITICFADDAIQNGRRDLPLLLRRVSAGHIILIDSTEERSTQLWRYMCNFTTFVAVFVMQNWKSSQKCERARKIRHEPNVAWTSVDRDGWGHMASPSHNPVDMRRNNNVIITSVFDVITTLSLRHVSGGNEFMLI